MTTLQERLDHYTAKFLAGASPEHAAVVRRMIDEMASYGPARRACGAGSFAPPFVLPDEDGRMISSAKLLEKGPLAIVFYRGRWCPYCSAELRAYDDTAPTIFASGAAIVAISPQNATGSQRPLRDKRLSFPLLGDPGGKTAGAFGIHWAFPAYARAALLQAGTNLEELNGDDSWVLPMPSRFVIEQSGRIAYAEVNADYTRRGDPEDLLPILEKLRRDRLK